MKSKEQLANSKAASAAVEAQLCDTKQQADTMSENNAFTTSQLAKGIAFRHAAEQEAQRLQSELDAVHQKIETASDFTNADAACAHAGHSDVLLNLARAVLKANLEPDSYIAQRLATTGSNLCKDSTRAWRFSYAEHRFFSLLRKVSRQAVELLQGPMHAGSVPEDTAVSSARFNDIVPMVGEPPRDGIKSTSKTSSFSPCGSTCSLCSSYLRSCVAKQSLRAPLLLPYRHV